MAAEKNLWMRTYGHAISLQLQPLLLQLRIITPGVLSQQERSLEFYMELVAVR